MIAIALALACLVSAAWPSVAASAPRLARVTVLRGLPPDAGQQKRFLEAFDAELARAEFPVERRDDDDWSGSSPAPNRFAVSEDADPEAAWVVEVSLGSPRPLTVAFRHSNVRRVVPGRTTSRGMVAAMEIVPPRIGDPSATRSSERQALVFPVPPPPADASYGVPETGYSFPWEDAGRAVARLALDALHHRTGELKAEERIALGPAVRTEAGR